MRTTPSPHFSLEAATLPLAWPTWDASAVMTWALALGACGATMVFAGNDPGQTQTMPLAMSLRFEVDLERASTRAVTLLVCVFGRLLAVKGLLRRRSD